MKLTDINDIKALLSRHGFHFSKTMGQNVLCAGWVPERIAEESEVDEATGVLEIGPGIGCLTRELSARAGKVVSVELDESLMPVLGETLRGCENVEVVFGDVMKKNVPALVDEAFAAFPKRAVCANLPYNITSPVITMLIESSCFDHITVMIQREVAKRICAKENTADYGAFTVLVQWYCEAKMLFDVSPGCFIPAPKVTSTVIRLVKRESPMCEVSDEKLMFAIVRAAFNQRRKTLMNALSNGLSGRFSKEQLAAAFAECGLDERIRGEALSIRQFAALANALAGESA